MPDITPAEVKARLDAGDALTIIDVRNAWELDITRLDNAVHIPLDQLPTRIAEIPKDVEVVLMCRSGGRSQRALDFLVANGYDAAKLLNMTGGIMRWGKDVDPSKPDFYPI